MALIICSECGKEFSDKASACPNCGCPTEESKVTAVAVQRQDTVTIVQESNVEKQEALKHLKYANSLEQASYTCKQAMWKIEAQMNNLGHEKKIAEPTVKRFSGWAFLGFLISAVALVWMIACVVSGGWDVSELLVGFAATGYLLVLFVGYEIALYVNHRSAWKTYRQKSSDDQARVKKELKERAILEEQWHVLDHELTAHKQLLKKLYSVDVLFPKYRNMVAVATILEYFESGICDKLTGADGAYSRYENDVKLGTIIDRLDAVVANLQQIRKAQYLLYQAIEESNAIAEEISYQATRVAEANGKIAENTKLIAYNAERSAFNTSVSAYVDTFY